MVDDKDAEKTEKLLKGALTESGIEVLSARCTIRDWKPMKV